MANALIEFEVPERISVSDAAERHRVLVNPKGYSGPWKNDTAPYLSRPMDCLGPDSPYSTVGVMGSAQSGKSEVGNNWHLHTIIYDPADMIFCAADKLMVHDYILTQVDKMIENCEALKSRQMGRDTIHLKAFRGCNFFGIWPTGKQMRVRPVPNIRVDDYDEFPLDIGGQGNLLQLLAGRQTTFIGFDKKYVNSSPARGKKRGIEALVRRGTNEIWWVDCLSCGDPFPLLTEEVFHYDAKGSPDDAERTACVVCPHCGSTFEQRHKTPLRATGRWVGKGEYADRGGKSGTLEANPIAGFTFDGLMGFLPWPVLAREGREAEITYETSDDEFELRAYYNTRVGCNYESRHAGKKPVTVDALKKRVETSDYQIKTVPPWVKCLVAAVDVQAKSFEVGVFGYGQGFECALIDRFAIVALEDGQTRIQPAHFPEHWGVLLEKVVKLKYPIAGNPDGECRIFCTAIDTGGEDGVTDNAYGFFHSAVGLGWPVTCFTLVKGGNKPNAKLLPPPTIDAKRQLKDRPDAELFIPNVNRIKDTLENRLRRESPGPNYFHLPHGLADEYVDELRAETKNGEIWEKDRHARNETWDLLVYSGVPLLRFGSNDPSLDWVPEWAQPQYSTPQSADGDKALEKVRVIKVGGQNK
ncbi:MAG: phage terminase large subunit family protein [Sphingomonadales bacterium]|nr:phage terminase large subunit family protein [Sphingomonadales bacterium]